MTAAIAAVGAVLPNSAAAAATGHDAATGVASAKFGDLLMGGVNHVDAAVQNANQLTRAFLVDDAIPVHHVTFALEQARMSLELMVQVRSRLVEAYQQIMQIQL